MHNNIKLKNLCNNFYQIHKILFTLMNYYIFITINSIIKIVMPYRYLVVLEKYEFKTEEGNKKPFNYLSKKVTIHR